MSCLQIQNPELVARLEKIKVRLAHEEYNKMVQNLNPSSQVWLYWNWLLHWLLNIFKQMSQFNKTGLLEGIAIYGIHEVSCRCIAHTVKAAYKQVGLVLNMALTVGCCFVFGYFAASYSSFKTDSVSIATIVVFITWHWVPYSFSVF